MNIKRLTIDSICLAILIVSAYISIPVTEIAFTLQMLVVLLLAFLLPISDALLVIVIYIITGLLGLPVFAGFNGGISYIFYPSFGYLIGFLIVPIIVKLANKINIKNSYIKNITISTICMFCIYIVGTIYFYLIQVFYLGENELSFFQVILLTIVPFIPFDIIKIITCSILINKIKPILKIEGNYENHKI